MQSSPLSCACNEMPQSHSENLSMPHICKKSIRFYRKVHNFRPPLKHFKVLFFGYVEKTS